eukprot:156639-Pelagomonas_calceolata.AAC.2
MGYIAVPTRQCLRGQLTRFTIGIQPSARKFGCSAYWANKIEYICLTCAGISRADMANRWNKRVKRFQLKQRNEGVWHVSV